MRRWGDSKAFFLLISVMFILFAGTAMTGCATSTALIKAAYEGQTDVVKDILDKGADPNERGGCAFGWPSVTPLSCAAYGGHIEAVKILIDRGADVDARDSINGWTPLTCAAHKGHVDIAKLLIERGADIKYAMARIEARDKAGPLAILDGYKDSYQLLERLANKHKQQPPRYGASPPMLPTALPLPTEPVAPF